MASTTPTSASAHVRGVAVRSRLASLARTMLRESALARVALGVVALHVVDDAFLQPQPGTAATDHLSSGLLPLALVLVAAWCYPRVREGARAAMALLGGVFGLVTAVEAVYYTRDGGPSGDDYTGLLAIPAAVLLLVIGARRLWRSRRLSRSLVRRYGRRALVGAVGLVGFAYVVFPVGFGYIHTHVGRTVQADIDFGPTAREVRFTTSDGLTLWGTYIPSRNGAAVIASPGYAGPEDHARMLARHGYGVLLFDQRGEGRSDGDPNGFGWQGERDLDAAIAFLRRQPDVEPGRIGGLGLSVAGELLLQTAAHNDALRAVVSEGAGSRSVGEWRRMPGAGALTLPLEAMITSATAVFSNGGPPDNLVDLVGQIAPRPVFLIYSPHGVDTEALNPTYYRAAGEPKTLWSIPEGGHTEGLTARPQEYEQRVIAFFDDALLG